MPTSPVTSVGPTTPVIHNRSESYSHAKSLVTAGASGAALGLLFKDGTSQGLHRFGSVATAVSNVISSGLSIAFPLNLLKNEHEFLTNTSGTKDDSIFGKMVNTAVSLGYMPVTLSEPLVSSTKSPAHFAATIMNLPHILFSFFAYTGGRALSLLKFIERKKAQGDHEKEYRIDQEFNSLFRLGNLGSAQATIIPMSSQFIMGWENIIDIAKGNYGDVTERLKENPISGFMGTVFNSWMFIPEWCSKCLDTSVRIAEGVDSYQNALSKDPDNSNLVQSLREFRDWWHTKTADRGSGLGKLLFKGREFSKITALIIPPIGMISVVLPTMNKFLRGEIFNKEAQEIGGVTGFLDKVTSLSGLAMHLRYTLPYAAFVRVPQFVTTSIFYGASAINKLRGKTHTDKGYIDPNRIRDRVFKKPGGIFDKLNKWAEEKIDKCDKELGISEEDKYIFKDKDGNTRCKQLRDYADTMLEESWEPVREACYDKVLQANKGKKDPSQWKEFIRERSTFDSSGNIISSDLLDMSLNRMKEYLQDSYLFDNDQMQYVQSHEDWAKKESRILKAINDEYHSLPSVSVEESQEDTKAKKEDHPEREVNGVKIPNNFWKLFTNPKALFETMQLKGTIKKFFGLLPFRIKGFVDIVDFGKETDEWWYRNYKAQITGIKEADVNVACAEELFPVTAFGYQTAGKGFALIRNAFCDREQFVENVFNSSNAY